MRSDAPVPTAFPWPSLCQSSPLVLLACVLGGVLCVGAGELVTLAFWFQHAAQVLDGLADARWRRERPGGHLLVVDVEHLVSHAHQVLAVGPPRHVLRALLVVDALTEVALDVGGGCTRGKVREIRRVAHHAPPVAGAACASASREGASGSLSACTAARRGSESATSASV